ncbi:MAG: thioredoxin-dependent thiol peroxidase [Bacteroidales bacterium]|nr:thioredoxin-dependent thiol peroxidase [Bacteroidales bacterium]
MITLKVGDKAPAINATDQHGNNVSLEALKGRKVVLYFYPKDDTPGCTAEACSLRDNYQQLISLGYSVIGVSPDNQPSHRKFAEKHELPFPLIADVDKNVIKEYGVWGLKKFMGREYEGVIRTTFIINEKGIIDEVISKVDTKNHAFQILNPG